MRWRFRLDRILARALHRVAARWGRDVVLGLIEAALIIVVAPLFGVSVDKASLLAIVVWVVTFFGLYGWNIAGMLIRPHHHHEWVATTEKSTTGDLFMSLKSRYGQVVMANQFRCVVREPGGVVSEYTDPGSGPRQRVWCPYHPVVFPGCSAPPPSGRYEIVWYAQDSRARWHELLRLADTVTIP